MFVPGLYLVISGISTFKCYFILYPLCEVFVYATALSDLLYFIVILEQLEISVITLLESACVKSRKNISILSVWVLIILGKLSFQLSKVDFVPAVKNIA